MFLDCGERGLLYNFRFFFVVFQRLFLFGVQYILPNFCHTYIHDDDFRHVVLKQAGVRDGHQQTENKPVMRAISTRLPACLAVLAVIGRIARLRVALSKGQKPACVLLQKQSTQRAIHPQKDHPQPRDGKGWSSI